MILDAPVAPGVQVVAHRGFADEAPENTVPALRRAATLADAVEFDVRRCGSGEPVVLHDETLGRVTTDDARVADRTLDELAVLDVLGSGAPVPSLGAVVAALPDDVDLVVGLKEPGLVADVRDVVADHEGTALLSSMSTSIVREIREDAPDYPRALVVRWNRRRPVTTAVELDCDALLAEWPLAFVPTICRAASDIDLPVYAWTVRSRVVAAALRRRAVDGLIVDDRTVLANSYRLFDDR